MALSELIILTASRCLHGELPPALACTVHQHYIHHTGPEITLHPSNRSRDHTTSITQVPRSHYIHQTGPEITLHPSHRSRDHTTSITQVPRSHYIHHTGPEITLYPSYRSGDHTVSITQVPRSDQFLMKRLHSCTLTSMGDFPTWHGCSLPGSQCPPSGTIHSVTSV